MKANPNPTLILPPRFSDDSNALWRAAVRLNWPVERLGSWRVPDDFKRPKRVAIYGESLWATFVAQQLGVDLWEPSPDWLAGLPRQFVGRDIGFGTLEEARELTFPLFVKPAAEKSFEARVYPSADELPPRDENWQESVMVLTSQAVEFEVEYRCFVAEGRVQTASSYWRGDRSTQDENGEYQAPRDELAAALAFVSKLLGEKQRYSVGSSDSVVIDVGIIRGFGWAVVEANPAFSSGIYGCDPERVLHAISKCVYE